jgi:hypothetical protein
MGHTAITCLSWWGAEQGGGNLFKFINEPSQLPLQIEASRRRCRSVSDGNNSIP